MGFGFGTMAGVGGAVGGMVGGMMNDVMGGIQPSRSIPQAGNAFCDNCGAQLTPGAAFCDECGTSQTSPDVCSNCGFKFIKPGKFCPKCGCKREVIMKKKGLAYAVLFIAFALHVILFIPQKTATFWIAYVQRTPFASDCNLKLAFKGTDT